MKYLILSLIFAAPCFADNALSQKEFEELAQDRTLYFFRDGVFFGAEEFHDNRLTTWKFSDGTCVSGRWYPIQDQICFEYEADPTPHCWTMHRLNSGDIEIRSVGDDAPEGQIMLRQVSENPIKCGPQVGA